MNIIHELPHETGYMDVEKVMEIMMTVNSVETAVFVALVLGVSNLLFRSIVSYRFERDKEIISLEAENKRLADLLYISSEPAP